MFLPATTIELSATLAVHVARKRERNSEIQSKAMRRGACKLQSSLPAGIGVALQVILDLIGGEREGERICFQYPHFVAVVSR